MSLNYFSCGIEAKGEGMGGINVCMYMKEKKMVKPFPVRWMGDEITKSFILNILIITLGLF